MTIEPSASTLMDQFIGDGYLRQDASLDSHLIYVANRFVEEVNLGDWARVDREDVYNRLRSEIGAARSKKTADRLETCLAFAVYRKLDGMLRRDAAMMLEEAAENLERISNSRDHTAGWLRDMGDHLADDARVQEAKLEAFGLSREQAAGLTIQLRNRKSARVIEDLTSPGGLCMATTTPLRMSHVRYVLGRRAADLRSFAADLPGNRNIPVLAEFPSLTASLLQSLDPGSFLAHVVRSHRTLRQLEEPEIKRLAGLRLPTDNIDTLMDWIIGQLAPQHAILDEAEQAFETKELSYVSGGMSSEEFAQVRHLNRHRAGASIFWQIAYQGLSSLVRTGLRSVPRRAGRPGP